MNRSSFVKTVTLSGLAAAIVGKVVKPKKKSSGNKRMVFRNNTYIEMFGNKFKLSQIDMPTGEPCWMIYDELNRETVEDFYKIIDDVKKRSLALGKT